MSDDRLHDVWAEGRAGRVDEAGWEPDDWAPVLRARRRRDLLVLGAMTLATVVPPVLRVVLLERPPALPSWFLLAFMLPYLALSLRSHVTSAGRSDWEEVTRQEIRIEHALRDHLSIGAANRDPVTEQARKTDSWAPAHFVGWPLLGVLAFAVIESAGELSLWQDAVAGLVVALLCAVFVLSAQRRVRLARRWLADPLPRDDEAR